MTSLKQEDYQTIVHQYQRLGIEDIENYTMPPLEKIIKDQFVTTRNPIEDPRVYQTGRAKGGTRSFIVLEEGYFDEEYGFWCIDE